MRGLLRAAFCAALLYPTQASLAATVFRCEDANGHITFTRHGCPTEQQQRIQNAHNQTPSSGKAVPLAKPARSTRASGASELVVVGQQDDGCGNRITGSARRAAIIKQEIRSGMTRSDVESSLGKPHKISRQNGLQRYHYRDNSGNTRQVSFDEAGCVKGK
jgi:hypothetical protein